MKPTEPTITKELLEYLDNVYPDKLPTNLSKPHTLYYLQGQISVLRYLKHVHIKQIKETPRVL